jgi:manganese transport protein
VLSQVILSLQLPFAIIPLIYFTSSRKRMGEFATPRWGKMLAWLAAFVILSMNLKLVYDTIVAGLETRHPAILYVLLPVATVTVPLLIWLLLEPLWRNLKESARTQLPSFSLSPSDASLARRYHRIGIALEAKSTDKDTLENVLPLVQAAQAELVLIHVVETAAARMLGEAVNDAQSQAAMDYLREVVTRLRDAGFNCIARLGAGEPEDEIARIAAAEKLDLIVTGGHGHRLLGDLFHGATVSELRHLTDIPVLSIRSRG